MISSIFQAVIYQPLYNGLVVLLDILPGWADAGIAIIILTFVVKLALFPLSRRAVETQLRIKEIEPELNALKAEFKDDRQTQAVKMMELYKKYKINPFLSSLLVFIQIPIIFGLFFIARSGLPTINPDIIYHFIPTPNVVNTNFIGLIDIAGKSFILAFGVGLSSFFQMKYSFPKPKPREKGATPSFKDDLARSMHIQMRFVMPVVLGFVSYYISGAVALYWITSNLFTIGQEVVTRRQFAKEKTAIKP
jgi:YidC/Oxa1 family membrane protein insertase